MEMLFKEAVSNLVQIGRQIDRCIFFVIVAGKNSSIGFIYDSQLYGCFFLQGTQYLLSIIRVIER